MKPFKIVKQPEWVYTMEDNVKYYGEPRWRYLKNVVYKDRKGKLYIASIRGDQEVNEVKLKRALGVDYLLPADKKDLVKLGTKHGYVHSWGEKAEYIGDLGLKAVKNFIGGQKTKTTDSINVNFGRDFSYRLADIVNAQKGDLCPLCRRGRLREHRGLEWGHTFKIDLFYSRPQKGVFIDKDGKEKYLWMGSYGIGLERCLAILVETHHDKKGIYWPAAVAPFKFHLLLLDGHQPEIKRRAEAVYQKLTKAGREVLYDDREEVSAGEKFVDADLIGCPYRLLVSKKTGSKIEVKKRRGKKARLLRLKEVLALK